MIFGASWTGAGWSCGGGDRHFLEEGQKGWEQAGRLLGQVEGSYYVDDVSLLVDRLGFPFEAEDGNDFEVATYEWGRTWR